MDRIAKNRQGTLRQGGRPRAPVCLGRVQHCHVREGRAQGDARVRHGQLGLHELHRPHPRGHLAPVRPQDARGGLGRHCRRGARSARIRPRRGRELQILRRPIGALGFAQGDGAAPRQRRPLPCPSCHPRAQDAQPGPPLHGAPRPQHQHENCWPAHGHEEAAAGVRAPGHGALVAPAAFRRFPGSVRNAHPARPAPAEARAPSRRPTPYE
mmetsp:Transcript_48900/g.93486  ORF Transcript_48900/g.93486 Transcript_48900/m.93486 type:complete len:211 (-) Transcript_48900:1264-1896(-)